MDPNLSSEYSWYKERIEKSTEEPREAVWESALISGEISRYLCVIQTPDGKKLYAVLSPEKYFGEGTLKIPFGWYSEDQCHPAILPLIKHNRNEYNPEMGMSAIAKDLGLIFNSRNNGTDAYCSSSGGSDQLFGLGYSLDLIRHFHISKEEASKYIQVPVNHRDLNTLAAVGYADYLQTKYPQLQITPVTSKQFLQGL